MDKNNWNPGNQYGKGNPNLASTILNGIATNTYNPSVSTLNAQQKGEVNALIEQYLNKSFFKLPRTAPHRHDGVDNIKINRNDLVGNKINSGTVTFSQKTKYFLAVNFNPSSLWFYGIAVNSLSAPTIRAQCIGNALLNGAFYMAPGTSTTTTVAKTQQDIAQSSSYILVDNSVQGYTISVGGFVTSITFPATHALADQGHLVDVEFGNTIYARMTVVDVAAGGIELNVDNLASGWSIVGNFVIT